MHAGSVIRIEKNVDRAASALLALACAFAAFSWISHQAAQRFAAPAALGAAVVAYLLTIRALGTISAEARLPVPPFEVWDFERLDARHLVVGDVPEPGAAGPSLRLLTDGRQISVEPEHGASGEFEPAELLLTDCYEAPAEVAEEPLLLDQVLTQLEPESRVVQLFDAATAPTPGQLKSRIDRHLDRSSSLELQSFDAAQALHEALAELRRSIR